MFIYSLLKKSKRVQQKPNTISYAILPLFYHRQTPGVNTIEFDLSNYL